jgi:hypothetical protein
MLMIVCHIFNGIIYLGIIFAYKKTQWFDYLDNFKPFIITDFQKVGAPRSALS